MVISKDIYYLSICAHYLAIKAANASELRTVEIWQILSVLLDVVN